MSTGAFTDRVRQELAGAPIVPDEARGELAVLLRLAARFHRVGTADGSHTTIELVSTSGATVRRAFRLLPSATGERPELWVREPRGVRGTTYGLVLRQQATAVAEELGLVEDGRPVPGLPTAGAVPTVRAMLLATTMLSAPGRPVHLEVRLPSEEAGEQLQAAARTLGARLHADASRGRLVCKSGEGVDVLLRAAGAPDAADALQERRHRRRLRNEATRLANADAANVRRSIEAAQEQLATVERAVARVGWAGLGEDLRGLALARLVNPEASLAELGELCDPPVGKSAVHRRLQRIARLADDDQEDP